ncbi:hypothetical protein F5Y16DRAFT_419679 [Xylariaceae sp. FL0255]|nr:hypothetical protein F5Y16DRAFT_419679 [Xylariaceae sp. FL0255]
MRPKIHTSCTFCRSRKIGCSGERSGCQRCTTMGLNCVYPPQRGRNKRQEKANYRFEQTQQDGSVSNKVTSNKEELGLEKSPKISEDSLSSLDNMEASTLDNDSSINASLFEPWMVSTTGQYGLEGGLLSQRSSIEASIYDFTAREIVFPSQKNSGTMALPDLQPELSTIDTPLTSSGNLSPREGTADLDLLEEVYIRPGSDLSWALSSDGQSRIGQSPETLPLDIWDKDRPKSVGCHCLLSSISFLDRLVSGAASCESRIDQLLGNVREAIETLAKFMACKNCVTHVELNVVLAMAARQIGVICGKAASSYRTMHKSSSGEPQQPAKPESSGSPAVEITVSRYRVSQREGLYLLKSLVALQITELQQHVNMMVWRYRNRPNEGQAGALREAKNQIKLAQAAIRSNS